MAETLTGEKGQSDTGEPGIGSPAPVGTAGGPVGYQVAHTLWSRHTAGCTTKST